MADNLDSRQLVEEYDELNEELETVTIILPGSEVRDMQKRQSMLAALLKELEENCEGDPADDGIQLVPKENFVEYAKEYAESCGYMSYIIKQPTFFYPEKEVEVAGEWPFNHIDWQAAADELEEEWTEIEFDGVTYLCR